MPSLENVERATEGATGGFVEAPNELTREQVVAREQSSLNSITFEQLIGNHEEAVATCAALEAALEHARVRRDILGAAVDRLNEPQDAKVL